MLTADISTSNSTNRCVALLPKLILHSQGFSVLAPIKSDRSQDSALPLLQYNGEMQCIERYHSVPHREMLW